jgi:chloride channel protein, CIC family
MEGSSMAAFLNLLKIPLIIRKKWEVLTQWASPWQLRQHEDKVLFLLTLLIGAIVGLVIVAFILLTENLGSRMYPSGGAAWRRIFIPVAGSLITGFLLLRYFPSARGSGIPQTKTALFLNSGIIHLRTVLGKFGCSSVSLASGIALGREGPSVQVGAGIASVLGRQLGLSPAKAKALVPIGAAAALAAAFNTPIAAVLFTLEEVLGDLHARVLGAIVLSSATSWMVLHLVLGDEPLFHVPAYQLVHPIELVFYAALGAAGGIVSVIFVKLLLGLRKHFLRMPAWTAWLQPAAGGLLVGILGWFMPAVLGVGYGHVSEALNSRMALGTMALLVALKLVATATCYASGNAGGIFGPSLFIGAMMGGAFGAGAHLILPDYTGSVGAYALVGMGAAFAGILRVPMTSVIMIFEITRDYSIIVPLMIANLISYFISSRLQKKPIYEALMHQDGIRLPTAPRDREAEKFVSDALRMPDKVFQGDDKIEEALTNLGSTSSTWPVVDRNGLMIGMVTRAQLHEAIQLDRRHCTMADLLPPLEPDAALNPEKLLWLYPDQPLGTALRRMDQSGLNVLPVVDRRKLRELVGVISLRDILSTQYVDEYGGAVTETERTAKASTAALGGLVTVIILMIGMAAFLSYYYRSQRSDRAEQYALSGNNLMQGGRYQEAVERYRNALSISHSNKDRLALATALVKAERWNEAEPYLHELVRETPNSGPANLGLGRIAVHRGDFQGAINYYHNSIYGYWPDHSQTDRAQIRLELIKFLGNAGRLTQVRIELLALMAENPDDIVMRRDIAHLLLNYGFPAESAPLFREFIKQSPYDSDAFAGLGQAEFALGNFLSAQRAFRTALNKNPGDAESKQKLGIADRILALDPNLRGLKSTERYERSRKLIETILNSLDQCVIAEAIPLSVSDAKIANAARKLIESKGKPRSNSDTAEITLNLAEQLRQMHISVCGLPKTSDEAFNIFMTQLSK